MNGPESHPYDEAEAAPCPMCENGNVKKTIDGNWECDTCPFGCESVKRIDL